MTERIYWLLLLVSLSAVVVNLDSYYMENKLVLDERTCELHFTLRAMPEEEVFQLPEGIQEIAWDPYYSNLCFRRN